MNDAASAATAADFGATQFHGVHAIALEAHIANRNGFTRQFFLGRGFDNRGAGTAAKQQTGGIAFGIATDEQNLFALLRHHVAEVGQREAFTNAAFAVDGNNLGLFGHLFGADRRWLNGSFGAQNIAHEIYRGHCRNCACAHAICLQSRTIFKQSASPKAVR